MKKENVLYDVVAETEKYEFVDAVNERLKKAWQCVGGISVVVGRSDISNESYTIYYQAMTKVEE